MIGAVKRLFLGQKHDRAPRNFPPELLYAIQNAFVFERGEPDPDDGPQIIVTVTTVGQWRWMGVEDAEAKLDRSWPDLGLAARHRAALLIRDQVAKGVRAAVREQRQAQGWVFDLDHNTPWRGW